MKSTNVVDRVLIGMALGAIAGFIYCIRAWWKARKEPSKIELTIKLEETTQKPIETNQEINESIRLPELNRENVKDKSMTESILIASPFIVLIIIIWIMVVPNINSSAKNETIQTNYNELPPPPPTIQISDGNRDANIWFEDGMRHFKNKKYKESIYSFNKAIEADPLFVRALVQRGLAYRNLNINDKAISDFLLAIFYNPKDTYPYIFISWVYQDNSDRINALKYINEAIKIDPLLDCLYRERGIIHANDGRYKEGHKDFTIAIKLNPNDTENFINRGKIYFIMNNYKSSLADFNKAIELDPKSANAYIFRAYVREQLGNLQQAKEDRRIAAQLETNKK